MPIATPLAHVRKLTTVLLICGILAPFAYAVTDIVAALLYPGYSFTEQAPSELFALVLPRVVSSSRSSASLASSS
jgi:hypothetical protein